MSYVYPTGLNHGFTAFSDYFAGRMSGVTGTPSGLPVATGGNGFLLAMCDAMIGAFAGPTGPVIDALGSGQVSPTGADYTGLAAGTFSAPLDRYYMLELDIAGMFCATADKTALFRFAVDSSGIAAPGTFRLPRNAVNQRGNGSFRQRVFMVAGTKTVTVEWRADGNFTFDSSTALSLHIT